jgi:hypothetical protein
MMNEDDTGLFEKLKSFPMPMDPSDPRIWEHQGKVGFFASKDGQFLLGNNNIRYHPLVEEH